MQLYPWLGHWIGYEGGDCKRVTGSGRGGGRLTNSIKLVRKQDALRVRFEGEMAHSMVVVAMKEES